MSSQRGCKCIDATFPSLWNGWRTWTGSSRTSAILNYVHVLADHDTHWLWHYVEVVLVVDLTMLLLGIYAQLHMRIPQHCNVDIRIIYWMAVHLPVARNGRPHSHSRFGWDWWHSRTSCLRRSFWMNPGLVWVLNCVTHKQLVSI